jgi:hypothetical protein
VHGSAVLTRILRRRSVTRPAVRAVPTIVQGTAQILRRRAQRGLPVNRRVAGAVMARQTRRVLSSPRRTTAAVARNVRATRRVARPIPLRQARRQPLPGARVLPSPVGRPTPRIRAGGVVAARTPSGRVVPARVVPVRSGGAVRRMPR